MKILMAVDGSPYTKKMVAYLVQHRELFAPASQEFTLLHVMPPLPARARAAISKEAQLQYYAEEAGQVTDPVMAFLARHDITPARLHKVGEPGETIAQTAEEGGFELLIMGSHGHGALGSLLMGSVTTQVVARCKVPVLLVR